MTTEIAVMAAGRGTRMDPLTRHRPKVMLPVAGMPLLEHIARNAVQAGFERVVLIVHAMADVVRAHFAELDLPVDFVDQGEPKGTGHAVGALDGAIQGDFVLVSGDTYLSVEDLQLLRTSPIPTIGAYDVDDVRAYGALEVRDGKMVGVLEKPTEQRPGPINTGSYHFPNRTIKDCHKIPKSPRGEYELTDGVSMLDDVNVVYLPSWLEAGRAWDLLGLQEKIMEDLPSLIAGQIDDNVVITGNVTIEPGARVLNGTRLEGPIIIKSGAVVGPHAYIRGKTAIGKNCHIGASVEIKNSIIMDNSNVPHLSYVGDSVIASGCNLGAGTQVANLKVNNRAVGIRWKGGKILDSGRRKLGIIMGDNVKTGINCTFNPGTVIGADCLVPAASAWAGWLEPDARRMAKNEEGGC